MPKTRHEQLKENMSVVTPVKQRVDYRADIDGLRAIAVLSVLIYHVGFYWQGEKILPGGFLGVDIFFVISGYLICKILLKEINAGAFSFINFYERRARRILPVFFFVVLLSAIVAPFLLSSEALQEFVSSIVPAGGFVSNFFFWLQDTYTAEPSLRKPLLHTWSLAVEEQFYLLFPLFLWIVWKKAAGKMTLIFSIAVGASLLYAEWSSYYLPSANFYLLPSRIWQLLAGAILAVLHSQGKFRQTHGAFAYLGFVLVVFSLLMFDDTTRHPSLYTLLPVVGTVMMIMAVPTSHCLNKMLSNKPMVVIGLISYSLYLWHQPVFAFARVYTGGELNVWHKTCLVGLCFTLAWLSWRFIETPFRLANKVSQQQLLYALSSFCIILLSFVVTAKLGVFADIIAHVKSQPHYSICHGRTNLFHEGSHCDGRSPENACAFVSGSGEKNWYLVGDSAAESLAYVLWERLQEHNASLTLLSRGGCPYIPNLLFTMDGEESCPKPHNLLRRKTFLETTLGVVVLHNLLHVYIHGSRNRPHLETNIFKLQRDLGATDKLSVKDISHHIHQAIKELLEHGHTVVLVYPIHMANFDVEHRIKELEEIPPYRRKYLLVSERFSQSYQEFREFADVAYRIYDSLGKHKNLIRVLPEEIFCDSTSSGRCQIIDSQGSLFFDFTHLSYYGACKLVSAIFAALPTELQRDHEFECKPTCK